MLRRFYLALGFLVGGLLGCSDDGDNAKTSDGGIALKGNPISGASSISASAKAEKGAMLAALAESDVTADLGSTTYLGGIAFAIGKEGDNVAFSKALPLDVAASALPASAIPASALPASALPASALPASLRGEVKFQDTNGGYVLAFAALNAGTQRKLLLCGVEGIAQSAETGLSLSCPIDGEFPGPISLSVALIWGTMQQIHGVKLAFTHPGHP